VKARNRKLHEALIRSTKGLVRAWEEWVVSQDIELDLEEPQAVQSNKPDSTNTTVNLPTRG
jgi:hypothetical protein